MNQDELESTVAKADQNLSRQRQGLEDSPAEIRDDGISSPFDGFRSGGSISLRPRVVSGGERRNETVNDIGLVSCNGGWKYVCEFKECPS